jgi:DNA polymerase-4
MNELGIHTGSDLRRQTREFLAARFGKSGDYYYAAARGEDDRPVVADRQRKSLGAETTFARDLLVWDEVAPVLAPVFAKVWAAYSEAGLVGRTVTVKVKYADFQQITRSRSCADAIMSQSVMEQFSYDLLRPLFPPKRGIRLLGVTLSNLDDATEPTRRQLALALA